MTNLYNYVLPAVAVILVAVLMHVVRVQTVDVYLILPLILLFVAGMLAGAAAKVFSREPSSY